MMRRFPVVIPAVIMFLMSGASAFALEPTLVPEPDMSWKSVQGTPSGNPLVIFNGDITSGKTIRERFPDTPSWIVSGDFDGGGVYGAAVLFSDGTLKVISLKDGRLRTTATTRKLASDVPPLVQAEVGGEPTGGMVGVDGRGDLVKIDAKTGRTRRLASGVSKFSHLAAFDLDSDGQTEIAAVNDEGHITIVEGRTGTRSDDSAELLPYTRITVADMDGDGDPEIFALSDPADRPAPGRLGGEQQARGIAVYTWDGRSVSLEDEFTLPDGEAFETLVPLLGGSGTNGDPVLVLPASVENGGFQIRSYSYEGSRLRENRKGPVSGEEEWINLLGIARMGDSGRTYVISTLIKGEREGGDLLYYRLDLAGTRLSLRSKVRSHQAGSRMLETALIGDMDRDGEVELLVPGEGGASLLLVSLDQSLLRETEVFSSSGKISTNLCPGDFDGDGVSDVVFGLEDGTLVILLGE